MSEADDFFTETIEANLDAFATIVLFQLRRTTGKLHFTTTYVDPDQPHQKHTSGLYRTDLSPIKGPKSNVFMVELRGIEPRSVLLSRCFNVYIIFIEWYVIFLFDLLTQKQM
jgi:hypothetical protein